MAAVPQLPVERGEQRIERAGAGQLLAEQSDRVLIWGDRAQVEAQEPQPAQPVADQKLHACVADRVLRRQDHRHWIVRWSTALGTVP